MTASGCRRGCRSHNTGTPTFRASCRQRARRRIGRGDMLQKTLAELNACSKDDFVAALANIFEYSPWIAEQAASMRPFSGVGPLFEAMKAAVDRAPPERRLALIKAHPDLGQQDPAGRGADRRSHAEQNSVGLDRLSDAEYEAFERVNNRYRSKFGVPYIVCVRRHTRDSILRDFERRLPNDARTETRKSIRGNLPDRCAAGRSTRDVGRSAGRARAGCRPTCWIPTPAGRRRGSRSKLVELFRARRQPRRDACDHQFGRPNRLRP